MHHCWLIAVFSCQQGHIVTSEIMANVDDCGRYCSGVSDDFIIKLILENNNTCSQVIFMTWFVYRLCYHGNSLAATNTAGTTGV